MTNSTHKIGDRVTLGPQDAGLLTWPDGTVTTVPVNGCDLTLTAPGTYIHGDDTYVVEDPAKPAKVTKVAQA